MALTNKLTAIADAIRGKTGKTEEMTLDQMATEIAGIVTGGGGTDGELPIGNYKFAYGQFTPTKTGWFTVPNVCPASANIVFAAIWIADQSVVSEKYGDTNIVLESHAAMLGFQAVIHYYASGSQSLVFKSQYGLKPWQGTLEYRSHANWPGQPETYNWIAVYE